MIDLNGKSILFISPAFFGYEKFIVKHLQKAGARVDYFDERPANSFWSKAFIRVNRGIVSSRIRKYYDYIWHQIQDKHYDYVLVVNIEAMPSAFLSRLRESSPGAKFILYMWDSVHNKKYTLGYLPYFNVVFSFDRNDCIDFPRIRFRPLFYVDEYKALVEDREYAYDLSFVGTAHSDRFLLIRQIRQQCIRRGLTSYWYLYLQSPKLFFWNKLHNRAYRGARCKDFSYVPLSQAVVRQVIRRSRIVLDIQHPKQTGLTMRTIETLGAGRKLITTNVAIKDYDFYHPDNILVIDRERPEISDRFYQLEYRPVAAEVYDKYSIDGWLEEIFGACMLSNVQ